jgi:hypothetical protein
VTDLQIARRAARVFPPLAYVPKHTRRHNQHAWMDAVRKLGPNWRALPINGAPHAQ